MFCFQEGPPTPPLCLGSSGGPKRMTFRCPKALPELAAKDLSHSLLAFQNIRGFILTSTTLNLFELGLSKACFLLYPVSAGSTPHTSVMHKSSRTAVFNTVELDPK